MDLSMSWKTLIAFALAFLAMTTNSQAAVAFTTSSSTLQPEQPVSMAGLTADQQLVRCIEIAKSGDVKKAFELAKQTKQLYRSQRMFDVSYINTLMTIVDQTQSKCDVKILNEVITVVNEAKQTQIYNGTQDPEVAYHFMVALGRLGELTELISESVASKIRIYQGQIAVNLKGNAKYPRNALEALAAPMVSMAKGYAFRKDQAKTFAALNNAVSVGFGEFETIYQEQWLTSVADQAAIAELKTSLAASYKVAVANWSKTVVAQFNPSSFNFDVPSLTGQRIRNGDMAGKVIVMDLWATWCPPCRKGIPHYMELQKQYGPKGVQVLGVSMDRPEDPNSAIAAVKAFAEKQKFNYPIAMGDQSIKGQLTQKMVLPTTIFFDRNGRVRYIARGYHDFAKVEAITKVLLEENQNVGATSTGFPVQNF